MALSNTAMLRFIAKVSPEPTSGCWLWTGATNGFGYGKFYLSQSRVYAHRFSYEAHVAPVPPGMHLYHKCRNTLCVNPAHLEPSSNRENSLRGAACAPLPKKQHCKHGHPVAVHGRRYGKWFICLECQKRRSRAYYARRSAPC